MTDNERLSALIDGEYQDDSLLDRVANDPQQSSVWQDYHLIGDVMRGDAPQTTQWDIAANVAAALDAEPAHQPAPVVPIESQPQPDVVRHTMPSWLRNFGQIATAACVSLAVIVGVQQYNGGSEDLVAAPPAAVPVLETVPFTGAAQPVSLDTRPQFETVQAAPSEEQLMEQRRRINAMLQDYELQLRLNADDGSIDRSIMEEQLQVSE
ncbi:RseA family anti-sigma factor [Thaumasiovibrio subtropicus]|uniref:RseA family anti-sigma factor n=1 Tax=Thaumasiovibrio subtropicus TaxID=1891207 RepID=UPI000B35F748|nr:RseA family anti-sigma factor [Thaumasiovibrio subtropicus]